MGIAITGVGIELAIEAAAAAHELSDGERLILCGGPALYLRAMALLRSAGAGHFTDRRVHTPREKCRRSVITRRLNRW
jgi:hypothetical protein